MYFTKETLLANRRLQGHWDSLWANRDVFDKSHKVMIQHYSGAMDSQMLAANSLAGDGLGREFWAEIDRQIIQMRDKEVGMEILDDLMGVQTILPIGKTAKMYNIVGDIADDVSISLDGQASYSFDHTDYTSDGDPIPVFTAGYGVNWRLAAGLNTVGIDLVLDSQMTKLRKFHKKRVGYYMDGYKDIKVNDYPAQGMRNHRNTVKINLGAGAGGVNIDLTSAKPEDVIDFFTTGVFGKVAIANKVTAYDVLWVSPEIWGNFTKLQVISIGADGAKVVANSILDSIKAIMRVKDVRQTYALSGNEFLGYQRRQDVISPLIGMAVGTVPLPRNMPQQNYNFQIMSAEGIQVKRDGAGLSGVVYGSNMG